MGLYNSKDIKWEKGYMGYPTAYLKVKTPSISTIISDMIDDPEFEEWKHQVGDDAEKILQYCAWRGTAMHLFCERFFLNYKDNRNKDTALIYAAEGRDELIKDGVPSKSIDQGWIFFMNIFNSSIVDKIEEVKQAEMKIYSPKLFVRGAFDILYTNSGRICMSDFKNATKPLKIGSIKEYKYKVQLGGYVNMLEDMTSGKLVLDEASIICSNKESSEIQETIITGEELKFYKEEFAKYAREWHIKNNQGFLLEIYK